MNEDDLSSILMSKFEKQVPPDVAESNEIFSLKDAMSLEAIEAIAESVVEFLCRMPIAYDIQFPLPTFPTVTDEIILSDRVRLVPRTILSGLGRQLEGATISLRANGFARNSLQHSAAKEALSILKVTLRLGALRQTFRQGVRQKPQLPSILPIDFATEVTHFAFIREQDSRTGVRIKLGTGLSRYLDCLNWVDRGNGQFPECLQELAPSLDMMYHSDAESNVRTIRRAMEWQFDALIEEDATTRFIKHCIGLEALLAEQSEDMGITEQLADRCAFLLSKTPDERTRRRAMVREVYKLRSKIVHGSVSGLSHKDAVTSRRASNLLESLLTVELDSVNTWWNRRAARIAQS